MSSVHSRVLAACVLLAASAFALGQGGPGDPVLIENGPIKLYRSEYEAELQKLAPEVRPGFANSQRRIAELITRMIVQKTLAAQAEAAHLAEQPQYAARVKLEQERMLAQLRIAEVEERAGREFDANRETFVARARELYVSDRAKYATPEQVSASHILFDLRKHSREEGQRLAAEARARVLAGADFNAVAKEVSEDPSAGMNAGHLGWFSRGDMDPAFANAAIALRNPGDVSEPVLSSFGWHIVKLEERRPAHQRTFDEVRDLILADVRKRYIEDQRDRLVASIRDDASMKPNREAIDALYVPVASAEALRGIAPPRPADAPAARAPGTPPPGLNRAAPTPR